VNVFVKSYGIIKYGDMVFCHVIFKWYRPFVRKNNEVVCEGRKVEYDAFLDIPPKIKNIVVMSVNILDFV